MSKPKFAIRTIRNGKVRILGHDYAPVNPLPEKFNGTRAAFGLYWGPPGNTGYDARGFAHSVSLWGSEEQYNAKTEKEFERLWPGPFCENGVFKWVLWVRQD